MFVFYCYDCNTSSMGDAEERRCAVCNKQSSITGYIEERRSIDKDRDPEPEDQTLESRS